MNTLFEYQRPIGQIVQELRNDRQTPVGPRQFCEVMSTHFRDDIASGLAAAQVVVERIETARREHAAGYVTFQSEWDNLEKSFRDLLETARSTRKSAVGTTHLRVL